MGKKRRERKGGEERGEERRRKKERKGEERGGEGIGGEEKGSGNGRGEEGNFFFFKWKKNLQNLRLGKEILNFTSKAQSIKGKGDKLDAVESINFYLVRKGSLLCK